MALDVAALRSEFPALRSGIAHFDNPGGTQTPAMVGAAIASTLTGPLSNRGGSVVSETNADAAVAGFRSAMADFLGASADGIIYGRSATQLTYDLARSVAKNWAPGDEIIVTSLDHDANIRPWVTAAQRSGVTVRWAEFNPNTAELSAASIADLLTERTRLVALTAASNLVGTKPQVAEIAALVHAAGALVAVDGVHFAAHSRVGIKELGADFFVCSPYKFLGPHCGVLAAAPGLLETLRPDKLLPSTEQVPERFELGTLPYEIMAGVTAAVDFLAALGGKGGDRAQRLDIAYREIEAHEDRLRGRIEQGLSELGAVCYSRAPERTPTLLFTVPGQDPQATATLLASKNVLAPADSFYALEAAKRLGLASSGGVRVGLAPYNDDSDVDRLLHALAAPAPV